MNAEPDDAEHMLDAVDGQGFDQGLRGRPIFTDLIIDSPWMNRG